MTQDISGAAFGALPGRSEARVYCFESDALRVRITDYGARMVSIETPDRHGVFGHVLLGFEDVAACDAAGGSFGAVLGRCANRIGGGSFVLDGMTHRLATNDGENTLHGGPVGFGRDIWRVAHSGASTLALVFDSPDGDQGFPGRLLARAQYRLDGDTLRLDLSATCQAPTIVNLSSHPYFNLRGAAAGDVLGHEVMIAARSMLVNDARQIPTGAFMPTAGTAFDFSTPRTMGARIRENHPQLLAGRGYDNCFVIDGDGMRLAARVRDPDSGRVVEVTTTQPGLQLYAGNSLDGSVIGRGGTAYRQSAGFALEAQNFPDAINRPEFPSPVLRPGETYRQSIAYRFYAEPEKQRP